MNDDRHGPHEGTHAGLPVLACTPGGAAGRAGLQRGDVVLEINDRPVRDALEFVAARELDPQTMRVKLRRGGRIVHLAIGLVRDGLPARTIHAPGGPFEA